MAAPLVMANSAASALPPANQQRSLRDLQPGDYATICCLEDAEMALKLLEMGCVPGQKVKMRSRAPLGGPITVVIGAEEYTLSLRLEEAATILLKP
jgi:ferrous iron transport protein A